MLMSYLRHAVLITLVLSYSVSILAKRSAPEPVADVFFNGTRYAVVHFAELNGRVVNGGYIEAYDVSTGNKIWAIVIYTIQYDAERERDVQDIFIKSMRVDPTGTHLVVTNENNEVYTIELATREVHRVERLN